MVEAVRDVGGGTRATNSMGGSVAGSLVQAGTIQAVHFHSRWDRRVPAQLPAAPAVFSGRQQEVAGLDECLTGDGPLPLAVLSGPGGIGKTALALHWLHRKRPDFPDGQLYADLGAFDPAGPVTPETALHWFLAALGVPAGEIPDSLAEKQAYFRSLTADRAMALLLDNAVSAAQVRPLLPATGAGITIVTSRWRLAGLATHGRYIELTHFDPDQSVAVLTELIGARRVSNEPMAADRLAAACAGLPIALSMVAARLCTRPRRSLEREAVVLEERSRLLRVSTEDSPLHAVFDASAGQLSSAGRAVYQLCGLLPAGSFGSEVITDVAETTAGEVEDGLEELVDGNLLVEDERERFYLHDLVKEHASTWATENLPELERETLRKTIVEWYLAMTVNADSVVHPYRWRVSRRYQADPLPHRRFSQRDAAMSWLERERTAVRGALWVAVRNEWHDLVWEFAEALWGFFLHHRDYQDWINIQEKGIESAGIVGHRLAEARLHSQMGYALAKTGRYQAAIDHNETAMRLGESEEHDPTVATAWSQIGRAKRGLGDLTDALVCYRKAAEIQERADIPRGVAMARRRAGDVLARLGRIDEAITELLEASRVMRELGDEAQHARTLMVIGPLYQRLNRGDEGLRLLSDALKRMRKLASPHYTAEALFALAELEAVRGDIGAAREHFAEAKGLYDSMRDPRADEVASRLGQLGIPEA
jgi:tetratricopeptide (TPR) repeat protein